jgi:hypothetical protein
MPLSAGRGTKFAGKAERREGCYFEIKTYRLTVLPAKLKLIPYELHISFVIKIPLK